MDKFAINDDSDEDDTGINDGIEESSNIVLDSTTADAIDAVVESLSIASPLQMASSAASIAVSSNAIDDVPLNLGELSNTASRKSTAASVSLASSSATSHPKVTFDANVDNKKHISIETLSSTAAATSSAAAVKAHHRRVASIKDYKIPLKVFKMLGSKDATDPDARESSSEHDSPMSAIGRLSKVAAAAMSSPRVGAAMKSLSTSIMNSNANGNGNSSTSNSNRLSLAHTSSSNSLSSSVPQLIKDCCAYLKENGLKEEGLFRISGSSERVEALLLAYQTASSNGENASADIMHILKKHSATPHETATLLKNYLQNVMDPLLDEDTRSDILEIVETKKKKGANVRKTIFEIIARLLRLPQRNKTILQYILEFLERVAMHELENKMTTTNLSRVFAPILLRDGNVQLQSPLIPKKKSSTITAEEIMQTLPKLVFITEVMIANHRALSL